MKLTRQVAWLTLLLLQLSVSVFSAIPDSLRNRIDSLLTVASASHGMQKYEAEFRLAWDLFDVDNQLAVGHAAIAYGLVVNGTDTIKIVRSGRLYGQLLRRTDKLNEAVETFKAILPLAERIPGREQMGKILHGLAIVYNNQGRFDEALAINLKVLRLVLAEGDSIRIGSSYINIGVIYYNMGNHHEAEIYFEKASLTGDSVIRGSGLINLALAKVYLDDLSSFPAIADQWLRTTPRRERPQMFPSYEFGYGMYFLKQGLTDSAEYHFGRALGYATSIGSLMLMLDARIGIARCKTQRGDFNAAVRDLSGVERDLSALGYNNIRALCYRAQSAAFEKSEKWREAFTYKSKQFALVDSLYHQNVQNNIAVARVEFEERENELRISKQQEVIDLNQKMITQQRWLVVFASAVTLLLVALVIMLYRFNKYQKNISRDLDNKVVERTHELQNNERALVRSLSEQAVLMQLVSSKVKASIATFRGLRRVDAMATGEDDSNASERFEAAAAELLRVSRIIDKSSDLRAAAMRGIDIIEPDWLDRSRS